MGTELYELATDPGQQKNLADEHSDILAKCGPITIRGGPASNRWWKISVP
jgi:hypothetical protein